MVAMPSSAEVSEIIAPAGSSMQMLPADGRGLPDLEGGEERPAALVDHRPRRSSPADKASASSCATLQVAAIDSPVSLIVSAGNSDQ